MTDALLEKLVFDVAYDIVLSRLDNRLLPETEIVEEAILVADELLEWLDGEENPRLEVEFQMEIGLLESILGWPSNN